MQVGALALVLVGAACIPTLEDRQNSPKSARKRSRAGPGGSVARNKPQGPVEVADFPKPAPIGDQAFTKKLGNEYADRFIAHWNDMHAAKNGYFSPEGVPYHAVETLLFYAAKSGDNAPAKLAKELLDRMWKKYRDDKGVAGPETRKDYKRFGDKIYIPAGWQGQMPNDDPMDSNSTFASIRTRYSKDPDWAKIEAAMHGGPAPTFTYHRFWGQADIALANATFAILYPDGIKGGSAPGADSKPAAEPKKGKGRKN